MPTAPTTSLVAGLDAAVHGFRTAVAATDLAAEDTAAGLSEEQAYSQTRTAIDSLLGSLSTLESEAAGTDVDVSHLRERFRATAGPMFYRSPLTRHAREKPYGYPGDFQMLEMIYENRMAAAGSGRLFDRYFLECHASNAVRLRRHLVANSIATRLRSAPGQKMRIMSVGCGPVRELIDAAAEQGMAAVELVLVDVNGPALDFAREKLAALERTGGTRFVLADVKELFREGSRLQQELASKSFDIIYSMGVFDYLKDDAVVTAISCFHEALRPGGICLIGNFDPRNPSRTYMEWVGDWRLRYRSSEQLIRMADAAAVPRSRIRVITETGHDGGINNILEVSAPSDADIRALDREHLVLGGMVDAAMIGGVLYPFWAIIDWFQLQSVGADLGLSAEEISRRFFLCISLRAGVTVASVVFVVLAHRIGDLPGRRSWLYAMGTGVHLLIGLGIVALTWIVGGPATNYFAGLVMVFIGITVLVPTGWKYTASQVGVLALSYLVMVTAWTFRHDLAAPESYSNLVFLLGAAIVCVWGAYKSRRGENEGFDIGISRPNHSVQRHADTQSDGKAFDHVMLTVLTIVAAVVTGIVAVLFGT